MSNLNKIREQAFKLAQTPYTESEIKYTDCSPIYIASTSNVKDTINLYTNYKSVLSVGGTGSFGFEAILNNATKIDLFDINELQILYFKYMRTAIMHLKYEDFIKYFTLKNQSTSMSRQEFSNLISNELWNKISNFVPKDVAYVFGPLFDYFDSTDLISSSLFRTEHYITLQYLKRYNSFYNEEQYYKLQKILRNESCNINYEHVSLVNVPKIYKDKYDLIILDNILQYYKTIPELNTPYAVNMFISKKLAPMLTERGQIQVSYGFDVASSAVKTLLGMPLNLSEDIQMKIIQKFIIEQDMKNGINCNLLSKWKNHYQYKFIPGVEQIEREGADNVILTYKK